jgi:hypothetical protein
MLLIKSELTSALIMASIVSVLVMFNTPQAPPGQPQPNRFNAFLKSFVLAFGITYAIFYFVGETGPDDAMSHIIKGEPNF